METVGPVKRSGPSPLEALAVLVAWLAADQMTAAALPSFFGPGAGRALGYWAVSVLRVAEGAALLGYWRARGRSLTDWGVLGPQVARGVRTGVRWALAAAALVAAAELVGRAATGTSFLSRVAGRPTPGGHLAALLVAGGLAGPVFEELLFRGVLYGSLRTRLSAVPATVLGSLLFASAHHSFSGVNPVQLAGGLLFCAAYEVSGSLWAPLILHVSGNLALFLAPFALP